MSMLEKTCFCSKCVASTEKQCTFQWKCKRVAVPFVLPAMPDIWIQELDADSTTKECDQDSTNKGENYEEELAKWESWLKQVGLTCPKETENLKTPSFVYILYVTEQICTQDTQHLPLNQRPMMAGRQRKGGWRGFRHCHATACVTPQSALQLLINWNELGSDNEKGCFKESRRKKT